MNNEQLYDRARGVLDMLAALHQQVDPPGSGLGAWILGLYYPSVTDDILAGCSDENLIRPLLLTRWATGRLDFSRVSHLCSAQHAIPQ